MDKRLEDAVTAMAAKHQLPEVIVRAIVMRESTANVHALRYEKDFDRRYNLKKGDYVPPHCTRDTEEVCRAISWGPMQVMGETARSVGFRGWFPALCDPEVGVAWGCEYLARLRDRFLAKGGWAAVLRAYNGGPGNWDNLENPYPDRVLAFVPGGVWPD